mmetsp:Transcript_62713/g.110743  ORF Transcript_62713/g.110743 Transcript_62713/m.110743 type:complete len:229 (-) Transcript_62713:2364-3050(-)
MRTGRDNMHTCKASFSSEISCPVRIDADDEVESLLEATLSASLLIDNAETLRSRSAALSYTTARSCGVKTELHTAAFTSTCSITKPTPCRGSRMSGPDSTARRNAAVHALCKRAQSRWNTAGLSATAMSPRTALVRLASTAMAFPPSSVLELSGIAFDQTLTCASALSKSTLVAWMVEPMLSTRLRRALEPVASSVVPSPRKQASTASVSGESAVGFVEPEKSAQNLP